MEDFSPVTGEEGNIIHNVSYAFVGNIFENIGTSHLVQKSQTTQLHNSVSISSNIATSNVSSYERIFSEQKELNELGLNHIIVLGKGKNGTSVHLCKHRTTKEYYALKIIPKGSQANLWQVDQMLREKDILSSLLHPLIIAQHWMKDYDTKVCIAYDAVLGGPLYKHIRASPRGKMALETVKFYAAELVLAIEFIHSESVIHRDIKASNVLLNEKGHIKVIDFGMARKIPRAAFSTNEMCAQTFCGTLHCMAPEMLLRSGHNHMVDWWALGILLFECLFGTPPFGYGKDQEALIDHIMNSEVTFPDAFQEKATKDFVRSLLQKCPTTRLGCVDCGGTNTIKHHQFFDSCSWDQILDNEGAMFNKNIGDLDQVEEECFNNENEVFIDQTMFAEF